MEAKRKMTPTGRTLLVLEYLMAAGPGPVKQIDIARACGLSPATLNRIVQELSEWGYLFRTSERYCVRNFRLTRNVPVSASYLAELERTVAELTEQTNAAAEVVVVAGHELLWHIRSEHPNSKVQIRAQAGFRRPLYELDALSRMYLSRLTEEELERRFYTEGFYFTGPTTDWISKSKALKIIAADRHETFAFDAEPNHLGIQRYATIVRSPDGAFLHLLSLADIRPENGNAASKVEAYGIALESARNRLDQLVKDEDASNRPPPMHHLVPQMGG